MLISKVFYKEKCLALYFQKEKKIYVYNKYICICDIILVYGIVKKYIV